MARAQYIKCLFWWNFNISIQCTAVFLNALNLQIKTENIHLFEICKRSFQSSFHILPIARCPLNFIPFECISNAIQIQCESRIENGIALNWIELNWCACFLSNIYFESFTKQNESFSLNRIWKIEFRCTESWHSHECTVMTVCLKWLIQWS